MKENIATPIFSATHLQSFRDKCYIRRRILILVNLMDVIQNQVFSYSLEMGAVTALCSAYCVVSTKQSQHLQTGLRFRDRNAIITSKWKCSCDFKLR